MSAARLALACALLLAFAAARAHAQEAPLEPPPEAAEGDYALERTEPLESSAIETRFGASGDAHGGTKRHDALRFRSDGVEGTVRDGADPLAGGRYRASLAGGTAAWGRLAPRWGRGLLLGGSDAPWRGEALDRGDGARFRGRAGDGAMLLWSHAELMSGRFAHRALAGVRVRAPFASGTAALGVLAPVRARSAPGAQGEAEWLGEGASAECAFDRRGRWRAEGTRAGELGALRVTLRARAGHAAFRSLAEPARSGPARALAAGAALQLGAARVRAEGALWAFDARSRGARAALESRQRLGQHASTSFGFEEQHGTRRVPSPGAAATPIGMRQGITAELARETRGRILTLRHELWGTRAFARNDVRRLLAAGFELPLPRGARLALLHAVWRSRRGEHLALPEDEADRITLRSLSGTGARTRLQLSARALGGGLRATLAWTEPAAPNAAPVWTLDWTRRAKP